MATSEFCYLKGWCKANGLFNSTKALSFVLEQHGNQTRNDGSPYYIHPVKVASHLAVLDLFSNKKKLDTLLSAALLHDVLEDTSITYEQLVRMFGEDTAYVVKLLTKTTGLTNEGYYAGIRGDLLASLVKIADRCHNVSTMAGVFTKARLQKYVTETNEVVKPLMRHTRDTYPEISGQVVSMSYHIKSVINAIEVMLPLMSE